MKKFDPRWLPYFGAIVQAGLFAIAGDRYFGPFGWLIGLGVGAVVNASLAVASSKVSDVAQKRKVLAHVALVGMFLLSPLTITLSLFMPASVLTAIAWAMSPDLAIVLAGAIAGKSLVQSSDSLKPLSKSLSEKKSRSAKESGRSRSQSGPLVLVACRYEGAGCKKTGSQNAMNAHAKHCKFKPTIDDSLMIKKNMEKQA